MVNRLRPCYHCYDHRSPWDLHHFLHHEFNFTPLYKKDSGTRITIKKSNKCLPMHTDLAFPPPFYSRSITHAVFVTQNAFQIFFPWQKYSWGLRRWGLRGGGGGKEGRSYNGNIYDTYWIIYSVAFQPLYRRYPFRRSKHNLLISPNLVCFDLKRIEHESLQAYENYFG